MYKIMYTFNNGVLINIVKTLLKFNFLHDIIQRISENKFQNTLKLIIYISMKKCVEEVLAWEKLHVLKKFVVK